ncbi:MAG: winged helix-turn-helix transcriptional regulator [Candidatus Marinimicrobia bacterium]|nr:winged helix-turn-helix transcriptional regulator [Candidatus Neomarinimicrobiota bacterium]
MIMIDFKKYSKILKAISHHHRLEIVINLYHNECSVTECQKRMHLPQSTVSQHLRILRDAGVIEDMRKGTTVCHKVVDPFVIDIINLLE